MKTSMFGRMRPVGLVLALVLGVAAVAALPSPAHAATATFQRDGEWGTGYVGKMTIRNDTAAPMTGWRVEFDLPAGTTVSSHWHAALIRNGSHYVFTNLPWNGNLAEGGSTSFGWVAAGTGLPLNCTLNGAPCAGGSTGPDIVPPTTPANPRTSSTSQTLTLHWDASTDDRGVIGYEIFSNGTRIRTTTETSDTMPTPPPMIFTFGIRAVDAAGNVSPFAIIRLGTLPDTGPPTAPTNLWPGGPRDDYFRLTWDAARDDVMVAGYEVRLNGVVVSLVGGTFGYAPYRGFGTYWFQVRAFDHAGNFSPPTEIGIAVDGPPPSPTPTR